MLTWLTAPDEEETEEATPAPRVISMPADERPEASDAARKMRGPIRMKSGSTTSKETTE